MPEEIHPPPSVRSGATPGCHRRARKNTVGTAARFMDDRRVMNQDLEHLRLLSIFHYVVGGVAAAFACIPIIHIVLGLMFILSPQAFEGGRPGNGPPPFLGWLFLIIGSVIVLCGWAVAGLMIYAGRCLSKRKHYLFCLIVAGISCLFVPMGTIL